MLSLFIIKLDLFCFLCSEHSCLSYLACKAYVLYYIVWLYHILHIII